MPRPRRGERLGRPVAGLLIEVHTDPSEAMTDGPQSITPEHFAELLASTRRIAAAVDREI